jgi:hypothetical protein
MARKGDPCPKRCGGRLMVRDSKRTGNTQVQILRCTWCGAKPDGDKITVLEAFITRRLPRPRTT